MAIACLRLVSVTSRKSWPSIRILPTSTSKSRATRLMTVDLPAPDRPTSATVLPPGTVSEPFSTARLWSPEAPNDLVNVMFLPWGVWRKASVSLS